MRTRALPGRGGFAWPMPPPATTFVGREAEVRELAALVLSRRLVTVVGPPGSGTSRLAAEVGRRLEPRFPDGVHVVNLADGDMSLDHLPAAGPPPGGEALLLLENVHTIVRAGPAIERLLRRRPGLRVVMTGPRPLGLGWCEEVYRVRPLAVPGRDDAGLTEAVAGFAAVRLFVDRARAHDPSFVLDGGSAAAVAAVCRRVDGLPLALELAAAALAVVPVVQLAERLERDLGLLSAGIGPAGRHGRLDEAVARSHELLDAGERAAVRRLAVFSGGFTLEGAEAVLSDDLASRALGLVASLVDASAVVSGTGGDGRARYRMLEVVRDHGLRRLAESGEAGSVHRLHCDHVRSVVSRAVAAQAGGGGGWSERLREERDNVRQAVAWLRPRDPVGAALLVTDVSWFWDGIDQVGPARECLRWILAPGQDAQDAPAGRVPSRPLTSREAQVARLVAEGLTNRSIAARLGIAERTVDAHVDHVRNKLGVRSRAQIAHWVAARGEP